MENNTNENLSNVNNTFPYSVISSSFENFFIFSIINSIPTFWEIKVLFSLLDSKRVESTQIPKEIIMSLF